MKKIGLTGGIGMGKSRAGEFISEFGLPVLDTDQIARDVVQPGMPALNEIRGDFGSDSILENGQLNRSWLARRVFGDDEARKRLEAILHPKIRNQWELDLHQWVEQGHRVGVVIIPLLFETKAESEFDSVICVACSSICQLERLRKRAWADKEIQQRIQSQLPIQEKMDRSDYVVWNDGGVAVLKEQLQILLGFQSFEE
ncbi:MAG TPA: dephospho-CoA kinase [Verrucomicrobiales bacterium]|nr:dephospho-CoA kinase [Verrucomicrobiales bacterium]HIL68904.1 dephospho-CoA kinase [Verrucomicrobiota bacterium]